MEDTDRRTNLLGGSLILLLLDRPIGSKPDASSGDAAEKEEDCSRSCTTSVEAHRRHCRRDDAEKVVPARVDC